MGNYYPSLTLTAEQEQKAEEVGLSRRAAARRCGIADGTVISRDGKNMDALGAKAELAFSLFTGLPWHSEIYTLEQYKNPSIRPGGGRDVGPYDVKATPYHSGHLLIQKTSGDQIPYALVIAKSPLYIFAGWCMGYAGKNKNYWRTDVERPCFFVPQWALNKFTKEGTAA